MHRTGENGPRHLNNGFLHTANRLRVLLSACNTAHIEQGRQNLNFLLTSY